MFPKKGKVFPGVSDPENGESSYAAMIATALQTELGNTHRAAKTLMRWTGASERTVKHWLSGFHGPGGDYLIALMRESEAVLETVLTASGRRDAVVAARMLAAQDTMLEAMAMAERERVDQARIRSVGDIQGGNEAVAGSYELENDRINDAVKDPVTPVAEDGVNPRQRWYLEALAAGRKVRAADLQHRWHVSEKTARRDLAALKMFGMIEFVGPFRTGRYRLIR